MMKKQYGGGDSGRVVMGVESLLYEILSRLPVESLMRFKCVSKQWQSLIQKDRSFTYLHLTRSKASNFTFAGGGGGGTGISLFINWLTPKYFSSAKLVLSQGGVAAVQTQREVPKPGSPLTRVFGAVNGLIALVDRSTSYVCIYNPSTGQSTPWIQPMFKQQHGQYINDNWFYFGYDPATMEHKVVLFGIKRICDGRGLLLHFENICAVMTVDGRQHNNNLSWRRIDDEFSFLTISPREFTSSLYANGSIYWLRTGSRYFVEFNVGSEKFRLISLPNYIIEKVRHRDVCIKLIEIDGRLAVLATTTWLSNTPSMKMCVSCDIVSSTVTSTSSSAGSSVSNTGDFYWTEETFMMIPHSDWAELEFNSIQAVPGTNLLIIKSEEEAHSSFYFYDWRKESFSKESFLIAKRKKRQPFEHFVYKESIFPVMSKLLA